MFCGCSFPKRTRARLQTPGVPESVCREAESEGLSCGSEYAFFQHLQQIVAITVILHATSRTFHFFGRDIAVAIGDFFWTGNHQTLAGFNRLNEERSLKHGLMRPCVEPGHAASHDI